MRHQGRNVFAARPQRWQQDREHVQTVVEVDAKFAPLHHLRQITVRCSHQPNVHLVSPSAAQALELLFLQDTEQFGLQCQRNIAHFIQEERAFVGQLETANPLRYGSGERDFLVAKKLTFQQIQRNGSAIQLCERASAPRADVVNRARDQLLAGACFALDKDGGICRRDAFDLFEHRFQSRTVAYELLESALIGNLIATPEIFESSHREPPAPRARSLSGSTLQSRSNSLEQGFLVKRFCQELHCCCSQRLHPHLCVAVRRSATG